MYYNLWVEWSIAMCFVNFHQNLLDGVRLPCLQGMRGSCVGEGGIMGTSTGSHHLPLRIFVVAGPPPPTVVNNNLLVWKFHRLLWIHYTEWEEFITFKILLEKEHLWGCLSVEASSSKSNSQTHLWLGAQVVFCSDSTHVHILAWLIELLKCTWLLYLMCYMYVKPVVHAASWRSGRTSSRSLSGEEAACACGETASGVGRGDGDRQGTHVHVVPWSLHAVLPL